MKKPRTILEFINDLEFYQDWSNIKHEKDNPLYR